MRTIKFNILCGYSQLGYAIPLVKSIIGTPYDAGMEWLYFHCPIVASVATENVKVDKNYVLANNVENSGFEPLNFFFQNYENINYLKPSVPEDRLLNADLHIQLMYINQVKDSL